MRLLRYAIWALIGLVLVILATANTDAVPVHLLPPDIGDYAGLSGAVELPLFLVIGAALVAGLILGFIWEWLREHKHRSAARKGRKEVRKLNREVTKLRDDEGPKDEVLALLETTPAKRRV
ncbi:LapA family protein [Thioclava sp. BHET1]|nr:LapA family protein [Thioclava sp. BHET1]